MRVLAAYNIKGGVGKTSAAVNLAHLASRDGLRTLLWDLDPQGAATFVYRVKPRVKGGGRNLVARATPLDAAIKATDYDDLDLVPADFSYRHMDLYLDEQKRPVRRLRKLLGPLREDYDLVLLDCPPSISLVSESVMDASDLLLVPLIPTTLSLNTFDQLTAFVREFDGRTPAVFAFFSMVDRRKRLHRDVVAELTSKRATIAATVIPSLSSIERMAGMRAPVTAWAPNSLAAECYEELWEEITKLLSTVER